MAMREMGVVSLLDALDYLVLLAELRPDRAPAAAIRWHGRLELEARAITLAESQLALAALTNVCAGERDAVEILSRLLRRAPCGAPSSKCQILKQRAGCGAVCS
jgi:hypothetical protein